MIHGAAVNGIANTSLDRMRTLVHTCINTSGNITNRTLSLMLSKFKDLDPSYRAHTEPIFAWASTVYNNTYPKHQLGRLFVHAARDQL